MSSQMNHKQNTASQYARDLEICEAATEGPWRAGSVFDDQNGLDKNHIQHTASGEWIAQCWDKYEENMLNWEANAEYIAHFNPTYVTQLIKKAQRCEELEEALQVVRRMADYTNAGDNIAAYIDTKELLKCPNTKHSQP